MNIGITGWRGFIGSHLSSRTGNPALFQGDMRNLDAVKQFVGQCDRIYHLAGKNRTDRNGDILANNLVGTGNLVLAAKLLDKGTEIVFASSKQVEWNPNSEYGMCKMIEESIIRKARKWAILRIPNVYGPGCKPFYNSVVATFCWQLVHGEPCTIHQPSATREFMYIEDVVNALMEPVWYRVTGLKGEVMSIREIHEYLTTRLGEHEKLKKCLDWYKDMVKQASKSMKENE
ncbi:MAG: NAD-dependent epimerase/dehydratase family protein [Sphaerochaeta sp.]|jgi:UDP-2-acetamido-2,6-beta-L-arabino-hexul-4-ose reductase|nr:NAD-dependent epimerase/dehydratase family protein [Sphaerochaeta sp.]